MIWGFAGPYHGGYNLWRGDTTINLLNFLAKNGFKAGHLGFKELEDPARRDQIGALITQHDLMMVPHPPIEFLNPDDDLVKRQTDAFFAAMTNYRAVLRAPIVAFGVGPYHRFMDKPTLAEQMDRLSKTVAPVARFCREVGCPLGIENHGDYYCSDLVELCKRVPGLGIFLDTGNTYLAGEQSVPACRAAAPYTIGTHFKDERVHPDPREMKFVIEGAALGDGHVGLEAIYKDLMTLNPDPRKIILLWELTPPKDADVWVSVERSWQFCRRIEKEYPPCPAKK